MSVSPLVSKYSIVLLRVTIAKLCVILCNRRQPVRQLFIYNAAKMALITCYGCPRCMNAHLMAQVTSCLRFGIFQVSDTNFIQAMQCL